MTAQVEPSFKATEDCPCGCLRPDGKPLHGRLLRSGHVRGCSCPRCRGGRNRKTGVALQRRFAKTAGIEQPKHRSQMGNEENLRDVTRWEIKSGRQVDRTVSLFEAARDQSEVSRALGDHRFFTMGVEPTEQRRPSLVIVDARDWRTHVVPLLREANQ